MRVLAQSLLSSLLVASAGAARASWTRPDSVVSTQPRYGSTLVFNATHLISVGGSNTDGVIMGADGFSLASNAWGDAVLANEATLTVSGGASAVVDPTTSYVFGGQLPTGALTNQLVLVTATALTVVNVNNNTLPPARKNAALVYLPNCYGSAQACLVLFGGTSGSNFLADLYVLDLRSAPPRWTLLAPAGTPPVGRHSMSAVARYDGSQAYFVGGMTAAGAVNDIFVLAPAGFADPTESEMTNLALLKPATMSTTDPLFSGGAARATDGIFTNNHNPL